MSGFDKGKGAYGDGRGRSAGPGQAQVAAPSEEMRRILEEVTPEQPGEKLFDEVAERVAIEVGRSGKAARRKKTSQPNCAAFMTK